MNPDRDWWPLHAALCWIINRNTDDAREVATNSGAKFEMRGKLHSHFPRRARDGSTLSCDAAEGSPERLAALVAWVERLGDKPAATADQAWQFLRDDIADEKVRARGRWHRHNPSPNGVCSDSEAPIHEVILPPAVEGYELWDRMFGGETILRHERAVMSNGGGLYWREVFVHRRDLQKHFPEHAKQQAVEKINLSAVVDSPYWPAMRTLFFMQYDDPEFMLWLDQPQRFEQLRSKDPDGAVFELALDFQFAANRVLPLPLIEFPTAWARLREAMIRGQVRTLEPVGGKFGEKIYPAHVQDDAPQRFNVNAEDVRRMFRPTKAVTRTAATTAPPPSVRPLATGKGAQKKAADFAIRQLWTRFQMQLQAGKSRNDAVRKYCAIEKIAVPSNRTIERAVRAHLSES
jgi:hypothetical protein